MPVPPPGPDDFVVLMPVLDDWDSVREVISRLSALHFPANTSLHVVIVDDGSVATCPPDLQPAAGAVASLHVIRLLRNLGHQRAIAVGLSWVTDNAPCKAVVVMDSDGEDKPEDVPRLLDAAGPAGFSAIVFAERVRRTEGLTFRLGYLAFRIVHRLVTGMRIRFGNFSVIPFPLVRRLAVTTEIWNHYAASVTRSRIPFATVPTRRGRRIAGRSRMNLPSLVTHGLSALSVHGELVATRLLMFTAALTAVPIGILAFVFGQRLFFPDWPIPGWTSQLSTLAVVLLVQTLTMSVVVSAVALMSRSNASFIPRRDYKWLIDSVTSPRT